MKKFAFACLLLLGLMAQADAASCFWVGGGSHVWSNTASWASATNGTPSTCAATGGYPHNSGDTATLDGSSGGGTVTFDATLNLGATGTITMNAFTGTLDNSANNVNLTLGAFNNTGAAVRSLNLGTGTITLTSASAAALWNFATLTNCTCTLNSSTIVMEGTNATGPITFSGGGGSYGTVTFSPTGASTNVISGANTFATWNITAGVSIFIPASTTTTVTNAPTWTGTSGSPIYLVSGTGGTQATISFSGGAPTGSWMGLRDVAGTGAATTPVFSNSLNFGHNTGVTITAPTGGGGGGFVGLIGGGI